MKPEYEVPTKSGRKMIIGYIERNGPKTNISPQTKRIANYIGDIDGTVPKRGYSISDVQRDVATGKSNLNLSSYKNANTRNTIVYN